MKVVIMAAGNGLRWNNFLGVPKQMIPINGEPLLHRTIRLLKERKIPYKDIVVTVPEKGFYGKLPCKEVVGDPTWSVDKFLNAYGDLYVYGDVYYTEEAMNTIVYTLEPSFYGRYTGSRITGKKWGEVFGVRPDDRMREIFKQIKEMDIPKRRGWEVYRLWAGYGINEDKVGDYWREIDDFTDDIDSPEEYHRWKTNYANFISKQA
jgi:hypothetical protein